MNILKLIIILSLCLTLNIISHGSLLSGVLNTLLLGLVLLFFQNFSGKKILSIRFPLIVLLGAIPLFTHYYKDIIIFFFAIGMIILFLLYIKIKFKIILSFIIFLYIAIAALYIGEIIRIPLSFQSDRLLFSDTRTNLAIIDIQKQALYIPYRIRLLIFNDSIYIYVILSKLADLFMIKNISNVLLLANLYPIVLSLILYLKSRDTRKILIFTSFLIISFIVVTSRVIDIFNTYLLLSPFLVYFILLGVDFVNKKLYFFLIILSLLLIYNPLK